MNDDELKKQIKGVVRTAIQHGFNRSFRALEEARAIDTKNMREHYKGVGSKYYDMVTKEMESTEEQLDCVIDEIVASAKMRYNDG
ncbi:hypothetical protein [Motilimonas cestriensis]|uniref:hypothetical protein n=1 Tax=Motilimonas cestriensis TaxID=2742685 RepID=UPI003DA4677D